MQTSDTVSCLVWAETGRPFFVEEDMVSENMRQRQSCLCKTPNIAFGILWLFFFKDRKREVERVGRTDVRAGNLRRKLLMWLGWFFGGWGRRQKPSRGCWWPASSGWHNPGEKKERSISTSWWSIVCWRDCWSLQESHLEQTGSLQRFASKVDCCKPFNGYETYFH